jgi:hypothetical protein
MTAPATGFLHDDIPYLRVGQGPPLVMIQGLSPAHDSSHLNVEATARLALAFLREEHA